MNAASFADIAELLIKEADIRVRFFAAFPSISRNDLGTRVDFRTVILRKDSVENILVQQFEALVILWWKPKLSRYLTCTAMKLLLDIL